MADIADLFVGIYQDGIYVSVNGGELKKVPGKQKIKELAAAESIKGLELGYQLYGAEVLELTVEDANISNGVVRVIQERDCVVKLAHARLLASRKISCGKCVFCREGLIQIEEMHREIVEGKGKPEHLEITGEIGEAMRDGCLCSMGQEAAKTTLSAQRYFNGEYEKHIKKKECPAGACFSSKSVYIDPNICTGCEKCAEVYPADTILGRRGYIHIIDSIDCTQCGACAGVCEEGSVAISAGKPPKLSDRLTKYGRDVPHQVQIRFQLVAAGRGGYQP